MMQTIDIKYNNNSFSVNYIILNDSLCFFNIKENYYKTEIKLFFEYCIKKEKKYNLRFIEYKTRTKHSFQEYRDWKNSVNTTISFKGDNINKEYNVNHREIISYLFQDRSEVAILEYGLLDEYNEIEKLLVNSDNIDYITQYLEKNVKLMELIRDNYFNSFRIIHQNTKLNLEVNDGNYIKVALLNNRENFIKYFIEKEFDFNKIIIVEEVFKTLNEVNIKILNLLSNYNNFVDFFTNNEINAKKEIKDYNKIKNFINLKRF